MRNYRLAVFWLVCVLPCHLLAKPLAPQEVPEPLKPWIGWALQDHEQRVCPFVYNNAEDRHCAWATRLELSLDETSGRFAAFWQVDAESWAGLPGGAALWPQQVELDGKPAVVAERDGAPAVRLPPGPHRLAGRFVWERLPESLAIPRDSGLIALTVKGQPASPVFNAQGELWLQGLKAGPREAVANALSLRVFRRIIDEVPLRVATRLDVEAAGEQREVLLAGGLLPEAIPLELSSPLPARLEADGRLRVLLRPGRWPIELMARLPGETGQLRLAAAPAEPWPSEEVWSFEAHPENRVVEIDGARTADPRQTEMPEEWKNLPAYRLAAGGALAFKTLRRGDPAAAPDDLSLRRNLWLDFDGGGYTVHDEITGSLSRNWRLDALPGLVPGRVDIDGAPQSLTLLDGAGQAGVELRRGQVRLAADSRGAGGLSRWPATGWARDFQSVAAQLNLPPGWRLLAATGVDNAPGTWVGRWTLLDLLVVLIAAVGLAKLRGMAGGALALAALVLLWQEPGAPRTVWLHLLAAVALLQALPEGRIAKAVGLYRNLAVLALAFTALPFMVGQVRTAFYPQLEYGGGAVEAGAWSGPPTDTLWRSRTAGEPPMQNAPASAPPRMDENYAVPALKSMSPAGEDSAQGAGPDGTLQSGGYARPAAPERKRPWPAKMKGDAASNAEPLRESDPDALTQTGPGLPRWRWQTVNLSWNGPVLADQEVGLVLLSPAANLVLKLLRVLLLPALAWVLLRGGWPRIPPSGTQALGLVLLAVLSSPPAKADMPGPELLGELKTRLLAPPECLPACAQIASLRLMLGADSLALRLDIHAQAAVAVPLPAHEGQWLPARASVDGAEADTLFRAADGTLWLGLKPGRHDIVLAGPPPARGQVQLALPLRPHRVDVEGGGWKVEGIKENGEPEGQLQLTRALAEGQAQAAPELEARPLPPFLEVRRTLRLGLDWRATTELVRISPADAPVVLDIPLLEGESVTTPGLQVKDGKLAASLAPGQSSMAWDSVLEKRPAIDLKAPQTTAWTEVWRAEASPVWHLEIAGLAVARHQDAQGNRRPEWRPWPGEGATLRLSRPKAAPGAALTVEASRLRLAPGLRATGASLSLDIRSSQGGQHTLRLPPGAALQSARIDGVERPIRQQGQAVALPIRPGTQAISLSWRQETGIVPRFAAPEVDLGAPSVNSAVTVALGRDRWVLLAAGPALGPAVLFWGVAAVLALAAFGLGRLDWTPLRARQWFLLLIGLSQAPLAATACVVGWLFALGWRRRRGAALDDRRFNAAQLGLALLSAMALASLFYAVSGGLLGLPDMQVAGNGSDAWMLNWYQDRSPGRLPRPWVLTAPLWSYRLLMLLWALWLAHSLLNWLRWGYGCFAAEGLWRAKKRA
jgi:hypothetical protein